MSATTVVTDNEPEWPYQLTDAQMARVTAAMTKHLEGAMDEYWDAARAAAKDMDPRKEGL